MPSLYLKNHKGFIRWHSIGTSGPTVVWLPGIGFPALGNFINTVTDPALPAMRALLIDPLGAGDSDPIAGLSITDHADAIADVLDHLGTGPCYVIGYSMGGAIAAELTLRRSDLVSRLILAEGNLLIGGGPSTRTMAAVSVGEFRDQYLPQRLDDLRKSAMAGDALSDFILASWGKTDATALHGMAQASVALRPTLAAEIFSLSLPRTFIFGADNIAEPGMPASKNLPEPDDLRAAGFSVLAMTGAGHDLMLTNPSGFAALIAPALTP